MRGTTSGTWGRRRQRAGCGRRCARGSAEVAGAGRCRGRPQGRSLTGRHRASVFAGPRGGTGSATVRAGYPQEHHDCTSEPYCNLRRSRRRTAPRCRTGRDAQAAGGGPLVVPIRSVTGSSTPSRPLARHQRHRGAGGGAALGIGRLDDGGQLHGAQPGQVRAVEPHDADVVGHAQPQPGRRLQHPGGQDVALRDHGGRPHVGGHVQQRPAGRLALVDGVARRLDDGHRPEHVLDALDPVPHVAVVRPGAARRVDRAAGAVEAQRHRDDRDAAVAQLVQVRGELARCRRGRRCRSARRPSATGPSTPTMGTPRARSRSSAGSSSSPQVAKIAASSGMRASWSAAGRPESPASRSRPDAVRAEHLGDPVEQLDGDGVAEGVEQAFADEGADHADAAAAQRRGDRVRARVAELGGGGEDAVPGGGGDPRAAGERERRRRRRDPGPRGDGGEGRPAGRGAGATGVHARRYRVERRAGRRVRSSQSNRFDQGSS